MSNPSKSHSRLTIAIGLLTLIALSVGVTLIAASRIRSPAEAAARTLAPEPSAILVPIESRVISSEIVTRGTGRFGSPQTLSVPPTNLRPSSGYVDSTPTVGAEIGDGEVALVHSGRPIILVKGEQPAFRDMGPGMSGNDVMQLELALERLGFPPGAIDGTFDQHTEAAVATWYRALGYEPIAATAGQIETIRAIEDDIGAVEREATAALESIAAARTELVAAQAALRSANAATTRASEAVLSARREADAATAAAAAEARVATAAAEQAWIQLPAAWDSSEEEQSALFELENLRIVAAAAEANVDQVRATGEAAVAAAENEAAAAPGEAEIAAAAVNVAYSRLELAIQIAELAAAPVDRLEADLVSAEKRAGIQVPADELIFVPDVPVRVAEVHVQRGEPLDGPLVSVTDAVVAIDGSLALDQVALVEPGMTVQVEEPDLGIDAEAVVSFVAAGPGTQGADGFHVYFEALVTDATTPVANIVGASVRLTLSVESSGGTVLAVPASALTLAVDGSSQILVDRNGTIEAVTVTPGLAAAGYVEIDPGQATLATGDLVVIGFEQQGDANG